MIDAPPEVAMARKLLRQVAPLQGSKARVYEQVVTSSARRKRVGVRVALVGFCLAGSTSAMALGYQWVANRSTMPAGAAASGLAALRPTPVPRMPDHRRIDPDPRLTNGSEAPAQNEANTTVGPARRTLNPAAASNAARQRPAVVATEKASPVEPPAAPVVEVSELSQQVRDYHEAVAPMRTNPQLALSRLRAYRSKWPQSAIGEEVDLRVVEALLALGRRHEAASAAGRFTRRYPGSARAAEMRRLSEESARAGVFDD